MNEHERAIFGGGLTFRDLREGDRFQFARTPDGPTMVKGKAGWFRYLAGAGRAYRTGPHVPVVRATLEVR
jgi:hypothetical protein